MYSDMLIRSIEVHWEEIAEGAIQRIRQEEDLPHMQKLTDLELRNWAHELLETLQSRSLAGSDESVASAYRELGRLRFETSVNLYEVVRCLHILKIRTIEFVRNRGFAQSSIEVYAQEELEHSVNLFFDWVLYSIVHGYEAAQRGTARLRQ